MPMKGSYDKITNPGREKYNPPPVVKTDAPGIWATKPAMSAGIPGKYGASGKMGPKK